MKKGIIVASFGTTYEDTRKLCIESIEDIIREKYRDYLVLRAFTSQMVINILKKRDNIHVFNLEEAIRDMENQGIEDIYIQPLHIIPGHEYEKLTKYNLKVGLPLLSLEEDYMKIVENIGISELGNNEALVFMGHGSDHEADESYEILENLYHKKGFTNVFIGTVEGSKTIEDIIKELKEKNIKKVKLKPFMLVAGDHAVNDMASEDDDSWKSILEREGFQVEVCLKGLGEYKITQEIFLEHFEKIIGEK
ncbi:sirohydrochlorin cobaltochelatase [Tissierella carlieri]|uniref:Sirohydrochlorin cobaltochelatase n=1 Tax=Tissierella carlieri TaxID=689904 RepID=A0ABT1S8P4_9FIRM|nr:sirohydrochlorin cobaltochelatase [Tissierella carlieri]MBU5312435.1 sirohydrochlorin cobaltochelatase [Tissierella carlieri]MCQ4922842.1 sirohydrochlorin cobaltochelatase [Tissierella carlieri]